MKYIREKNLVGQFFENIDKDTGMIVYGVQDTMRAVEANTLKTLICVDVLQYLRVEVQSKMNDGIYVCSCSEVDKVFQRH